MSNEVAIFEKGQQAVAVSSRFQELIDSGQANDLSEGIRQSFGIISIKGGKFRIKYKGEETPITDENGEARPSIELVIVKANNFLNKQYYKGKYVEGNSAPPDCYSLDGKVPSPNVQTPVHSNCAGCPMNAFGSLVSESGVKQKACRDTKKLAVVPLFDLKNAGFGGPMLLRVPPSALRDLASFSEVMKSRGYPYNSVGVRVGFAMDAAHPKPTFKAIRPLTDDEAEVILEHFHSDAVERILTDNEAAPAEEVGAAAPAATDPDFEVPPAQAVQAQPLRMAPPPAPLAPKVPAPAFAAPPAQATAPVAPPAAVRVPKPAKPRAAPAVTAPAFGAPPAVAAPPASAPEDATPPGTQLDDDIANILSGLNLTPGQ